MTLVSKVGGASGPLYGTFFLRFGTALAGAGLTRRRRSGRRCTAGVGGILQRGKAGARATRPCTTPGRPPSTRTTLAVARRIGSRRCADRGGRGGRQGPGRDRAAGGTQGSRELPRRAQRRPPGPGRDEHHVAVGVGCSHAPMIGIVVVSHSRALAEAAVGLASEMVAEDNRPVIAVAAGLDETTFGTDATAVSEAIDDRRQPGRRTVLLDLGSAVLSAETGLGVRRSRARRARPVVQRATGRGPGRRSGDRVHRRRPRRGGGRGRARVAREAGPPREVGGAAESTAAVEADQTVEVAVSNEHGLHARPAARARWPGQWFRCHCHAHRSRHRAWAG